MLRTLAYNMLHPFWQRAPSAVRRWLMWQGASKFLIGVAAVCLNPSNQMLLLEHRFHNEHPWGFPGGWMDRGETPAAAILRELREETGLAASITDILAVSGDGEWVEIVFLCHVAGDSTPTIQTDEALGYRWVDPNACPFELSPFHQRIVEAVVARLAGQHTPHFPLTVRNGAAAANKKQSN